MSNYESYFVLYLFYGKLNTSWYSVEANKDKNYILNFPENVLNINQDITTYRTLCVGTNQVTQHYGRSSINQDSAKDRI
jgi:hypothetical protein